MCQNGVFFLVRHDFLPVQKRILIHLIHFLIHFVLAGIFGQLNLKVVCSIAEKWKFVTSYYIYI